jgi:hypothetical protein
MTVWTGAQPAPHAQSHHHRPGASSHRTRPAPDPKHDVSDVSASAASSCRAVRRRAVRRRDVRTVPAVSARPANPRRRGGGDLWSAAAATATTGILAAVSAR